MDSTFSQFQADPNKDGHLIDIQNYNMDPNLSPPDFDKRLFFHKNTPKYSKLVKIVNFRLDFSA